MLSPRLNENVSRTLAISAFAVAQDTTAILEGRITEMSRGYLLGATVRFVDPDTGFTQFLGISAYAACDFDRGCAALDLALPRSYTPVLNRHY